MIKFLGEIVDIRHFHDFKVIFVVSFVDFLEFIVFLVFLEFHLILVDFLGLELVTVQAGIVLVVFVVFISDMLFWGPSI